MTFRTWSILLPSALLAVSLAQPAQAVVTLNNSAAHFNSAVGGANVNFSNLDTLPGNEIVRWGDPVTPGLQSGLAFATAAPQVITANVQFTLGNLAFSNFPVFGGTAISQVDLDITSSLDVDGTPLSAGPFLFTIGVDETPNVLPCTYPSTTPCSDRILISAGPQSSTFNLGGETLTLFIDGFLDSGGNAQTSFIAQESMTTTATLVGRFAVADNAVPEPATWAMMIGGFGLVGGSMRAARRRQRAGLAAA
jgi:PEP-CTERM motif